MDWKVFVVGSNDIVGYAEDIVMAGTGTDADDQTRLWCLFVDLKDPWKTLPVEDPGDEKRIGMSWRADQKNPKPFQGVMESTTKGVIKYWQM